MAAPNAPMADRRVSVLIGRGLIVRLEGSMDFSFRFSSRIGNAK